MTADVPARPFCDPEATQYLNFLDQVAFEDVAGLREAQVHYGNSWKRRGGVGAYMMAVRKFDRIEKRLSEIRSGVNRWDIFEHLAADDRPEGLIDDLRDLRRYLMLIEAEARAQGILSALSTHRDNSVAVSGVSFMEAMNLIHYLRLKSSDFASDLDRGEKPVDAFSGHFVSWQEVISQCQTEADTRRLNWLEAQLAAVVETADGTTIIDDEDGDGIRECIDRAMEEPDPPTATEGGA